ncbi:MAG: D-alanyl-D-alanine carboxypeptidase/D-alanyl-D-alanine-endopeptidase [Pelomonas sp.]|nr:D-alanyl-D-alanine carboxypeptidase/D-alanyl-D-alanine-endopeptidase [Roseateles sp.]
MRHASRPRLHRPHRLFRLAVALAATLALGACANFAPAPTPVEQALSQAGIPLEHLAIVAFPLDARDAGLRLNADRPMQPASTMKLLTAVVALDRLGPNARGFTELLVDGTPHDGRVDGALVLRGGADTDLDWGALWNLLRELREQGVREIGGGLVVDRSLFRPARLDVGAPAFDEEPEFPYNTIPDALFLNAGLVDVRLDADATRLHARPDPAWPGLQVDADGAVLVDAPCANWDDVWTTPTLRDAGAAGQTLVATGPFPRGCARTQGFNSFDRARVAAAAVRTIWAELGGTLAAGDIEGAAPASAHVVARHEGRTLADVLRETLKDSDNPLARLTYLRLGAQVAAPGEDTRAAAERVERAWLAEHRIDATGLVLDNGSGLSRSERITAAQEAALLLASHDGLHGPELLGTLPVAGVDGTLAHRLKNGPATGRARLKTGTLNNAIGLAGYVPDAHGRTWIVAALLNDPQASRKGRAVLDAVADWVARQ